MSVLTHISDTRIILSSFRIQLFSDDALQHLKGRKRKFVQLPASEYDDFLYIRSPKRYVESVSMIAYFLLRSVDGRRRRAMCCSSHGMNIPRRVSESWHLVCFQEYVCSQPCGNLRCAKQVACDMH